MFVPYMHLEKYGTDDTEGLCNELDYMYIFPKLDGTNASIWFSPESNSVKFGSRRRKISLASDNRGFCEKILNSERHQDLSSFLSGHSNLIFYGEWLVKHTLKTYLDSAWEHFYVFDVFDRKTNSYLSYDQYKPLVDIMSTIDSTFVLVPPLAVAKKLSSANIEKVLANNFYMMKEGEVGEGVVIKRYGFVNKYGRTVWAKIVRTEFTAKHVAGMGPRVINSADSLEEKIVSKFFSEHLVLKTKAKILSKHQVAGDTLPNRLIPETLMTIWHDFVCEELWGITKAYKNPTINFKQLNKLCYAEAKKILEI